MLISRSKEITSNYRNLGDNRFLSELMKILEKKIYIAMLLEYNLVYALSQEYHPSNSSHSGPKFVSALQYIYFCLKLILKLTLQVTQISLKSWLKIIIYIAFLCHLPTSCYYFFILLGSLVTSEISLNQRSFLISFLFILGKHSFHKFS